MTKNNTLIWLILAAAVITVIAVVFFTQQAKQPQGNTINFKTTATSIGKTNPDQNP